MTAIQNSRTITLTIPARLIRTVAFVVLALAAVALLAFAMSTAPVGWCLGTIAAGVVAITVLGAVRQGEEADKTQFDIR